MHPCPSPIERLTALLLLLLLCSSAQAQTIYSVHTYAGGVRYERDWTIVIHSHRFGLSQQSWWEDARGSRIMNLDEQNEKNGTQQRFTSVHMGSSSFRVHASAWLVAGLGALFGTVLLLLILFVAGKARTRLPPSVYSASSAV